MNADEIVSAIESLEYLIGGDCCDNQMDFLEEIGMGIAALREQAEREKGCDYCGLIYKLDGASYGTDSVIIENRFCPMCGKRLEVERDG